MVDKITTMSRRRLGLCIGVLQRSRVVRLCRLSHLSG